MNKIEMLNDLKALEMKKQNIESIISSMATNFEKRTMITINGKNLKVGNTSLSGLLKKEVEKAENEYKNLLKSLIDESGDF